MLRGGTRRRLRASLERELPPLAAASLQTNHHLLMHKSPSCALLYTVQLPDMYGITKYIWLSGDPSSLYASTLSTFSCFTALSAVSSRRKLSLPCCLSRRFTATSLFIQIPATRASQMHLNTPQHWGSTSAHLRVDTLGAPVLWSDVYELTWRNSLREAGLNKLECITRAQKHP